MTMKLVRLWFGGAALRVTLLAIPPLLPLIGDDLHLSATGVALLTGFPILMLACAALLGPLLIARLGARKSIFACLLLTAAAASLRSLAPTPLALDVATLAMGAGIAAAQPAMAALVRGWMPNRVGFGTAVYTNGLLIGEILPAAMTGPLVLPLVGGDWRWALLVWSLPVFAIAALFAGSDTSRGRVGQRRCPPAGGQPGAIPSSGASA